jgi:alpha-N-arabinofuranosidase
LTKLPCFALASALLAFAAPCALAQMAATTLSIDTGAAKAKSSPMLYGLMTEEINYSYDGGLYGELVRNRVVEHGFGSMDHWSLVQQGMAKATMSIDTATGPSTAIPASLKLEVASASPENKAGLENEGYWGIPLRPQTTYQASFYAKSTLADGSVTVTLLDDDTGKPIVEQTVQHVGTAWQRYSVTLETPAGLTASSRNHLVLSVSQPGTLWVNLVSLFPPTYHDRKNGNRVDLMEKLAGMHPAFLRLPGGNYLEGDTIPQRFEWKKTIGPLVDRPTHESPWGYRSSDGMGLLEFLEWCEDLKIQPVLAVYAGYSLKGEHVEPGPALVPYVQDALEEIEYLTGDSSTQWGAERVKDGHPAPFKLHYIEIGNEDEFDKSGSYSGRYAQFYDALKAKYPQYELIATTTVANHKYDVLDDHYYRSAQEFYDDVDHYDHTDRNGPKIFVGEWATREGTPTPNFGAALGDAAWMTGMERNSDIIVMSSYAPLLTNVNPGGLQWDTDLIGYNAMSSYGSPSYYAQAMFSKYHGDEILKSSFSGSPLRLFESVTRDAATGTMYLKLVNATTLAAPVTVQLSGGEKMAASGTMFTLTAPSTEATNSINDPTRIVPAQKPLTQVGASFTVMLAPLSINVLEVPGKR